MACLNVSFALVSALRSSVFVSARQLPHARFAIAITFGAYQLTHYYNLLRGRMQTACSWRCMAIGFVGCYTNSWLWLVEKVTFMKLGLVYF